MSLQLSLFSHFLSILEKSKCDCSFVCAGKFKPRHFTTSRLSKHQLQTGYTEDCKNGDEPLTSIILEKSVNADFNYPKVLSKPQRLQVGHANI